MNEEELQNSGVSTHFGFPNAAIGSHKQIVDLSALLIKNPSATFLMRIEGNSWQKQGINGGDIAIIDRALAPMTNDIVIWWEGEEFLLGNKSQVPRDTAIWGVVAHVIHRLRDLS